MWPSESFRNISDARIPGQNPGRVTRSPPQREIVKLPRRLRTKSGRKIPTCKLTGNRKYILILQ